MMATAIEQARQAGIAIACCVADAGGTSSCLERMDGGRFQHLAFMHRQGGLRGLEPARTSAKGAVGQDLSDVVHALGLALAAGPERWTAMEGGVPVMVGGECIGGVGVSGGDWQTDLRIAKAAVELIGASWK